VSCGREHRRGSLTYFVECERAAARTLMYTAEETSSEAFDDCDPQVTWAGLPRALGSRRAQLSRIKTALGGECVFALVLDCEHGVIGCQRFRQSRLSSSFCFQCHGRTPRRSGRDDILAQSRRQAPHGNVKRLPKSRRLKSAHAPH